jgi:putative FmdB family regulatory protein
MEYVYVCKKCEKEFSMVGSMITLNSIIPECPDCKSKDVTKKIFAPDAVYKGKGFYKTDNRAEHVEMSE